MAYQFHTRRIQRGIFTNFLSTWFVSLIALGASFVVGKTADGTLYLTGWGALLLGLSTIVMTSTMWSSDPEALPYLSILSLPAIPSTAYILVSVAVPEAAELRSKQLFRWLVVIDITVSGLSFFGRKIQLRLHELP